MIAEVLIDPTRTEIKLDRYATAPASALNDPGLLPQVQEYRRQLAGRMYPLARTDISHRLPAARYHVSKKLDGQFEVLVYRGGKAISLNPGGTVRMGLPFHEEAAARLSAAGVKEAIIAGELYADHGSRRTRVHDIATISRQPRSKDDLEHIRFAVFDIMSRDGRPLDGTFDSTWQTIVEWFRDGKSIRPVETTFVNDARGIEEYFTKWVEQDGHEGLVVRSDTAGMFKIKPLHTLDAVVVGFTEGTDERQGLLHDMLLAVMRDDGSFHVLCRVGGGLRDDDRRMMLSDLKDMVVPSDYAEVNSDHVAYLMVKPKWVIEISCLDMIAQTTRGGPVNRMVLNWDGTEARYQAVRRLPLCSVISPQFLRRREDKRAQPLDTRIAQIAEVVEVPLADADARKMTLAKSELLRREVYTKILKGATMVRKFLLWKTNKENENEDYPAYVVHMTDFSPNRKMPLQREIRVSNSLEQIESLWNALKEENVKKGWNVVGAT